MGFENLDAWEKRRAEIEEEERQERLEQAKRSYLNPELRTYDGKYND